MSQGKRGNKGRSYAWRNEILLLLHEAGFHNAVKAAELKGLAPGQERPVRGDILGLEFAIATRNCQTIDLAGALHEVEREAEAEGKDFWISVQARKGYPPEKAFVTTTLDALLPVLRQAFPRAVRTSR